VLQLQASDSILGSDLYLWFLKFKYSINLGCMLSLIIQIQDCNDLKPWSKNLWIIRDHTIDWCEINSEFCQSHKVTFRSASIYGYTLHMRILASF
jgi:hypothetical protein